MSTATEKSITAHDVLEVVNPFDLKAIGSVTLSDWDAINKFLEVAHGLFRNRDNWLPAYRRIEILKNAAKLMEDRFEPLAYQIANEGGKPLIDARVEVARAIDRGWAMHQGAFTPSRKGSPDGPDRSRSQTHGLHNP